MYSDDIASLLFDHGIPRWRMGSARIFQKLVFRSLKMYSDDIGSLLFGHRSPRRRVGSAKIFKKLALSAWKCTQMTLYLCYLIMGAPGGGWVVPAFLKIGL